MEIENKKKKAKGKRLAKILMRDFKDKSKNNPSNKWVPYKMGGMNNKLFCKKLLIDDLNQQLKEKYLELKEMQVKEAEASGRIEPSPELKGMAKYFMRLCIKYYGLVSKNNNMGIPMWIEAEEIGTKVQLYKHHIITTGSPDFSVVTFL